MKKLRLLADHVLVRKIEEDDVTSSGLIYIPEIAKDLPYKGEIVSVGPGRYGERGIGLQPGDKVMYGKYAGNDLEWNEEQCTILRESDVVAILQGTAQTD